MDYGEHSHYIESSFRVHAFKRVLYQFYYYTVTGSDMSEIKCFIAIRKYDEKILDVNLKCLRGCKIIFSIE